MWFYPFLCPTPPKCLSEVEIPSKLGELQWDLLKAPWSSYPLWNHLPCVVPTGLLLCIFHERFPLPFTGFSEPQMLLSKILYVSLLFGILLAFPFLPERLLFPLNFHDFFKKKNVYCLVVPSEWYSCCVIHNLIPALLCLSLSLFSDQQCGDVATAELSCPILLEPLLLRATPTTTPTPSLAPGPCEPLPATSFR